MVKAVLEGGHAVNGSHLENTVEQNERDEQCLTNERAIIATEEKADYTCEGV